MGKDVVREEDSSVSSQEINSIAEQLCKPGAFFEYFKDLEVFSNARFVDKNLAVNSVVSAENSSDYCLLKINKLTYDEDYPQREAFENVLMSMTSHSFNLVYILQGSKQGIELYLGVVKNKTQNNDNLNAVEYGKIVKNLFEGNFTGSELKVIKSKELKDILFSIYAKDKEDKDICGKKGDCSGVICGIPSLNKDENQDGKDFQGIDRLINSMLGEEKWRLVVVCEPVEGTKVKELQSDVHNIYNRLSLLSKMTLQKSVNSGTSVSFAESKTNTRSENKGYNDTFGKNTGGSSGSSSSSKNWGSNDSHTKSGSKTESVAKGDTKTGGINSGQSASITLEMANKHVQELMKYIDEELLARMKLGVNKGMYQTSVYYMAENPVCADKLRNAVLSLFKGDNSTFSPLLAESLSDVKKQEVLTTYQNQYAQSDFGSDVPLLFGRPVNGDNCVGLSSYLTVDEVSLLMGLPQKEVPGVTLSESVDFGLNVKEDKGQVSGKIEIGNLVSKGRKLDIPFELQKNCFNKHIFITGVTGSGKTTTCHKLLKEAKIPFLVIEPAKTEYRTLVNKDKEVTVFTLGEENVAPFRLNPFELVKGENISSHIDMIKATFTASFPMEGSMPQMLEEAIILSYNKMGWNVEDNAYTGSEEDPYSDEANCFPILSDLLGCMREVVQEKHFGTKMESEYLGSLVSRLSNLTKGAKGRMLNCQHSVNFDAIVEHKVVLELENMKSPEDKSLVMGFILSRLCAVVKEKHKRNKDFKHITLVEEAHRLLSKVEYGDSGAKKMSVDTFTDMLAEVRKYGEGLIIVDQIPNKLASEVLKNTNTKIVHRLFAKDDKNAIGDTMMMDDKQKEYLSALPVGQAIVFAENTDSPVHVAIKSETDTSEAEIADEEVKKRFEERASKFGSCYSKVEMGVQSLADEFKRYLADVYGKVYDKDKYQSIIGRANKIAKENKIGNCEEVMNKIYNRVLRLAGVPRTKQEEYLNFLRECTPSFCQEKAKIGDRKFTSFLVEVM